MAVRIVIKGEEFSLRIFVVILAASVNGPSVPRGPIPSIISLVKRKGIVSGHGSSYIIDNTKEVR
jgi:hypothetical protein